MLPVTISVRSLYALLLWHKCILVHSTIAQDPLSTILRVVKVLHEPTEISLHPRKWVATCVDSNWKLFIHDQIITTNCYYTFIELATFLFFFFKCKFAKWNQNSETFEFSGISKQEIQRNCSTIIKIQVIIILTMTYNFYSVKIIFKCLVTRDVFMGVRGIRTLAPRLRFFG